MCSLSSCPFFCQLAYGSQPLHSECACDHQIMCDRAVHVRSGSRTNAEQAVEGTAEAVQGGRDQAADGAQEGLDQPTGGKAHICKQDVMRL